MQNHEDVLRMLPIQLLFPQWKSHTILQISLFIASITQSIFLYHFPHFSKGALGDLCVAEQEVIIPRAGLPGKQDSVNNGFSHRHDVRDQVWGQASSRRNGSEMELQYTMRNWKTYCHKRDWFLAPLLKVNTKWREINRPLRRKCRKRDFSCSHEGLGLG